MVVKVALLLPLLDPEDEQAARRAAKDASASDIDRDLGLGMLT
jgi:hypothetical protein